MLVNDTMEIRSVALASAKRSYSYNQMLIYEFGASG